MMAGLIERFETKTGFDQGMTAWDAGRKRSFQFEFLGALHDRRERSIANLAAGDKEDQTFARWIKARGFSESDWAKIRSAPVWEPQPGAAFLRPMDVPDEALALRLAEAIDMETRLAVPQTTLWTRAKLIGENRPGTIWGELRRSWAQFRSFNLTASHLWGEEAVLRGQGAGMTPLVGTAAYIAPIVFALTIGGAMSIQLRMLAMGNDPKPTDDHRFWMAALLQGGGMGLLTDAIYAAEARNGKASQADAFGPGGQMVGDAYDATLGNVGEVAEGMRTGDDMGEAVEGANIGRDASKVVRRWTPGQNIWWARAAWNRAVMDQLQRIIDPEAEEDFERRAKRLQRDGQSQWWPEGEPLPERAPALAEPE